MDYKQLDGIILCAKDELSDVVLFNPRANKDMDVLYDDAIHWQSTEREICRLMDNSLVFADTQEAFEDKKKRLLVILQDQFIERISGAITTSHGYSMQFDTSDAIKMQGAIQLLEASGATEGYLTQANDETVYNVPLDVMKSVLIEMMRAFAACHARKQELRAQINAAQTKEDLDAVVISWPV